MEKFRTESSNKLLSKSVNQFLEKLLETFLKNKSSEKSLKNFKGISNEIL